MSARVRAHVVLNVLLGPSNTAESPAAPLDLPLLWQRIAMAQGAMRQDLAKQGRPVQCGGRGCSACCRGDILVTEEEWDALLPFLRDDVLDRMAEPPATSEERDKTRCALLGTDGACTVYAARPVICRHWLAVTPPANCDRDTNPGAQVAYATDPVTTELLVRQVHRGRPLALLLWQERARRRARRGGTA